jgi:hypothetical protein
VPGNVAAGTVYAQVPTSGTGDLTFTRASTATRTNSAGNIVNVATGVPRIDYRNANGSLSSTGRLLLEPQRTNLVTFSEQFDSVTWAKTQATVTANAAVSPDGYQDADKIVANTTNAVHNVNQTVIVGTSTTYTASIYAKKGEYSALRINFISSANAFVSVNLNTGVIQSFGGSIYLSSSITSVGNDWYRVTMTFLPTISSSLNFIIENPVGTVTFAGDNTSGIFLWGAQMEVGSYPTTYIPTTTAAVTRVADSFTRSNVFTNGFITSAGGTWFLEMDNNTAYTSDTSTGAIFLDTGTLGYTNGFMVRKNTAGRLIVIKYISTTGTTLHTTTTDRFKMAIKWNGSTADVFVNGVKVTTATAFTTTAMQFLSNGNNFFMAFLNQSSLFPVPMTDAQCIQITTL